VNIIEEKQWTADSKEYRFRIIQDEDPGGKSPREWDNLTRLAFWERRYQLPDPDENPSCTPEEWLEDLPEGAVYLPVYKYEHSGVCYQTTPFSCSWDSGQVGFVYTTPEILKSMGHEDPSKLDEEKVKSWLASDVDVYSQWANGDVYGFTLESRDAVPCGECDRLQEWEHEDSCWGFYGYDWKENGMADYLSEEAERALAA